MSFMYMCVCLYCIEPENNFQLIGRYKCITIIMLARHCVVKPYFRNIAK